MAQAQISWGSVAVGAVLGAGIAYAIVTRGKKKESKPASTEPPKPLPPLPPPDLGTGLHRSPMPTTQVWLPQTPQDRTEVDKKICEVWNDYEERPEIADVILDVLGDIAPEVDWPSVPGDHSSIPSLQAIVSYRIDQISQTSKNKSVWDNLDDFCKEVGVQPPPMGPGGLTP